MKTIIKKIFGGLLAGLGFCLSLFAFDKIFKPKMEIEIVSNKEESK